MKDPSAVAQNWAQQLGRSVQKITDGVNRVTEAPTVAAARQSDAYLAGVQNNVDKWKRKLLKVSLQDWQQAMLQKGVTRVAGGAQAAVSKMTDFMSQWLPYMEQLKAKIKGMPKGDLEASKQRAIAAIEFNAAFKARA